MIYKLDDIYYCDDTITDINIKKYLPNTKLLTPVTIEHRDPNINDEMFYIPNFENGNGVAISIYAPRYGYSESAKLNESDKKILMEVLNEGGWENIRDTFERGCDDVCGDKKYNCKKYLDRHNNFPSTPPDYTQLPY